MHEVAMETNLIHPHSTHTRGNIMSWKTQTILEGFVKAGQENTISAKQVSQGLDLFEIQISGPDVGVLLNEDGTIKRDEAGNMTIVVMQATDSRKVRSGLGNVFSRLPGEASRPEAAPAEAPASAEESASDESASDEAASGDEEAAESE